MLRQALDAAKNQVPTESTSLASEQDSSYGATSDATTPQAPGDDPNNEEDEEDDEDEDYGEDEDSWEEDDDTQDEEVEETALQLFWSRIKSCFRVVANVENLWDDPPDPQTRRLNQLIVLFWFVVLASSYAGERSTFKLLVDDAGCFRLFAVLMMTGIHAILLALFMVLSMCMNRQDSQQEKIKLGISVVDVGLMAMLDTVALLLVFLSGYHVPPTLTVILVQFTLPLTAFLTQFVHPDGRCSCVIPPVAAPEPPQNGRTAEQSTSNQNAPVLSPSNGGPYTSMQHNRYQHDSDDDDVEPLVRRNTIGAEGEPMKNMGGLSATHVWGATIIFMAVLLALVPAVYSIIDPAAFLYADPIPVRTAINTLIYVSSCIPAAASQLYKEHAFLQYKQPVNMNYLNLLLSIFQFTFAAIVSPLVFGLQGLGSIGEWSTLYPSKQFGENMMDGLKCFFWSLSDDDQENKYAEESFCDFCFGLTIFHALSIIGLGVAVDKIVNAGATKVMYRGMSAGIILAALVMHTYDMNITDFSYGPAVDGLNLVCVILLILGSEVYHRVGLKESTFETVYQVVAFEYDDG